MWAPAPPPGQCSPESGARVRAAFPAGSAAPREDGVRVSGSARAPLRALLPLGTRPPQGRSSESRLPRSAAPRRRHSRPDTLSSGYSALPQGRGPVQLLLLSSRPFPASPAASALRAAARVVLPALGALAGPGPMGWASPRGPAPKPRPQKPRPEAPPCLQAPGFGGGW